MRQNKNRGEVDDVFKRMAGVGATDIKERNENGKSYKKIKQKILVHFNYYLANYYKLHIHSALYGLVTRTNKGGKHPYYREIL